MRLAVHVRWFCIRHCFLCMISTAQLFSAQNQSRDQLRLISTCIGHCSQTISGSVLERPEWNKQDLRIRLQRALLAQMYVVILDVTSYCFYLSIVTRNWGHYRDIITNSLKSTILKNNSVLRLLVCVCMCVCVYACACVLHVLHI